MHSWHGSEVKITIITRARFGYKVIPNESHGAELAITIQYLTSANGIIVYSINAAKVR